MAKRKRILDPVARCSEILFGLIMAMTFTGSLSAATSGREEVRTMLIGAIGCNIAWGIVDAVMYLIAQITERGRELRAVRAVRSSPDPAESRRMVAEALPAFAASALPESAIETMRQRLADLPEVPEHPRWTREDFLGALGVFLLVVISTFPVVIPFMLFDRTLVAMRVSNGVALILLFLCGHRLGHYADNRPWRMGLVMAVIGSALVALTIVLGG